MIVAFVVSVIAIRFLLVYIKNNDFKALRLVPHPPGPLGPRIFRSGLEFKQPTVCVIESPRLGFSRQWAEYVLPYLHLYY